LPGRAFRHGTLEGAPVPFRSYFAQEFGLETWVAAAVFGLVALTMLAAFGVSHARRRRGKPSSQRLEAHKLEFSYLGLLACVAAFLATFSITRNNAETSDPPGPALTVRVTGFQWCWQFSYQGTPVSVTGQCASGHPVVWVMPTQRPVRVEVTSKDVIHGFWVPYLRWKVYAYPGHTNTFTVTLTRTGTWPGRCSEFCGLYHDQMDLTLRAVPPAQFDQWLHAHGGPAAAVRP
jgi:cytochrome c oxidase subunit 2